MARNWQGLSPDYRHRLERSGITQQQYESGISLTKARGHQFTAPFNRWLKRQENFYGRDRQMMIAELAGINRGKLLQAIQLQEKAEDLYNEGRMSEATRLWNMRDTSLPDWIYYYHGYFS